MYSFKTQSIWSNPDLLIRSGSHLYGCATPTSDIDLRGFVVEPGEYILGRKKFEQYEDKESDTVVWGFCKFFELVERGSPNTLEILFAPREAYAVLTPRGEKMLDNKNLFLSRQVTESIRGFASSEWLKAQLLTKNKETGEVYYSARVVGAKRKDSHAEFGYCLKNAYHAIRLLEEGIEILTTGQLNFPRPNANLLLAIRNGEMEFEEVSSMVDLRKKEFAEAESASSLPKRPDREALDDLYFEIVNEEVKNFLETRGRKRVRL